MNACEPLVLPVVRIERERDGNGWFVLRREHAWLYGSRVEASADATLIARGFDVPVIDRSGGRS